jgi:hypothetical protein
MKLHAEEWVFAMGDAHDLAVTARFFGPGGDFEFFGERVGLDHEAMVASGLEGVVEAGEEAFAIVVDHVGLAVHEVFGTHDRAAERLAHGLMAEAYAKKRQLALEPLTTFNRDTGFARRAWSGRNDDAFGFAVEDFVDRDLVVAMDLDVELGIDLAQPLHEVVRKRIVVIDEEDHGEGFGMLDTGDREKDDYGLSFELV